MLPGRWPDAVVPGAETRKQVVLAGRDSLAELDFAAETLWLRRGRHRPAAPAADPVQVVAAELRAFLDCVETRRPPEADLHTGAVLPALVLDAARRSAQEQRMVAVEEA